MSKNLFPSGLRRLWCLCQCVFWMSWIPCPTSSNRRLPNTWLTFTAPSMISQRYILKIYIIIIITALLLFIWFDFATFQCYFFKSDLPSKWSSTQLYDPKVVSWANQPLRKDTHNEAWGTECKNHSSWKWSGKTSCYKCHGKLHLKQKFSVWYSKIQLQKFFFIFVISI